MYKIYADDHLVYDSRLPYRAITAGEIQLEAGKSGSFIFSMLPSNASFMHVKRLKTIIKVLRNGMRIFRGRVISSASGFYREQTYTCEGELSFLLDSMQRPFSVNKSPEDIFGDFIEAHNDQVETDKQFVVGSVTITGASTAIQWSNDSYESTLENLNKLIEYCGGYLHVTENAQGKSVLNWYGDFPHGDTQSIKFGENLLDFMREISAEEIVTAVIPLGAKYTDTVGGQEVVRRVTISSVNSGVDYVYDQTAVTTYGWIFKPVIFDDIIAPATLKAAGEERLQEYTIGTTTIELTALDMSALNADIKSFLVGDYIRVISPPHSINTEYLLTQQTINLLDPEEDKITLGATYKTLSFMALMNAMKAISMSDKMSTMETRERSREFHEWAALTLTNDFEAYDDTSTYAPKYQVIGDVVYVRGIVSPTTSRHQQQMDPATIATGIPTDYRPAYDMEFLCPGSGTHRWVCTVTTTGTVTVSRHSNTEGLPLTEKLSFVVCYSL